VVVENGRLTGLDETELIEQVNGVVEKLYRKAGL